MIRLIAVAVVLVLGYWILLFALQRSIVFPAPPAPQDVRLPPDARQLWLRIPAGRTEAWLLPPLTSSPELAPLLIFAHGNGELIDYWPAQFLEPRRWGLAVLLVEYPGYGRSAGRPSEATIKAAFEAAFDAAVAIPEIDSRSIVLYGRSLGGGAVAALAQARPARAMILESTFTSTMAFAGRFLAPGWLVRDRFDNMKAVRDFRGPILILHGEHDEVVPVTQGRRLAEVAGIELELMPCGHNDCARPWPQIRAFLTARSVIPPVL